MSQKPQISCNAIVAVFDENFQHIQGDIADNVFSKIEIFEEDFIKNTSKDVRTESDIYDEFNDNSSKNTPQLKNVFRHNNRVYFAFVGEQDKNFYLVEFK